MNNKKLLSLVWIFLFALPSWAQTNQEEPSSFDWAVENIVMIMGVAVLVGASFALYRSMKTIWRTQTISSFESEGMSHEKAVKTANQKSFISYIYRELAGGVPIEKEADVLLNHNYDGIQELDNNLPPWWVGMFYVSILISFVYIGVYHFSSYGISSAQQYEQEVRDAEIAIAAFAEAQKKAKESSTEKVVEIKAYTDLDKIAAGEKTFQTYCVACHGKLGEGMVGLGQNLTDDYWIHGGGVENILTTVSNGVPATTMIPWKTSLSEEQILEVSSFILTLRGTNPPNAREPEGELWTSESE